MLQYEFADDTNWCVGNSKTSRADKSEDDDNTCPAYFTRLLTRFPKALTKHQWLKLVNQILPGSHEKDLLVKAIHDSLDLAFENGFNQGRAAR
jgi:hypothetical protein